MITAIIQARLNSTRLPKKVLLPFPCPPRTVLDAVICQVEQSLVNRVVLASPDKELNKYCFDFWHEIGDENDLVNRYYFAACAYRADPIVRITSDCPLILPEVIDLVIKEHFLYGCDYTYNRCDDAPNGWPDGLDVEIFSFHALQRAYILAKEREHFTFIKNNSTVHAVKPDRYYGPCTSINTRKDYEKALQIHKNRLK